MKRILLCLATFATLFTCADAQEIFRLGIIGLDTSHSIRFSELLNAKDSDDPIVQRFEVVAAYPYGTTTIESASKRIPQYTEDIQKYGVKIVGSIRELLDRVDGVFIELGAKSAADLAMDMDVMPEMDDSIKVKEDCSTEVPGIFACGDITGRPWQVAKAVGQGAVAGMSAADYVKGVNDAD